MLDVERIGKIITDIGNYKRELESYKILKIDDLEDSLKYHATAMIIFSILNRIIDLGNEIISSERVGAPNSYKDIMPLISKAGYINKMQADELNKLIEERNKMAHFYYEMNEKVLFSLVKKINLIDPLINIIKKKISKKEISDSEENAI